MATKKNTLKPTVTIGGAPAGYQPVSPLQPTVTIGGAPAGYKPTTSMQPTVTIGGAPAGYTSTTTPNYITGVGVPGSPVYQAPTTPNYITGQGVTTLTRTTSTTSATTTATTARALLEAALRAEGIPNDIIQSSVAFLEALDNDGIDDVADMVSIYFNNKDFTTKSGTKLTSPFYQKYTSLAEGVTNPATGRPYTGKEMFAWRTGIEQKVDQYNLSAAFKTDDVLKKLAKSGRSVASFDELAQTAILAETEADPYKVAALRKLGYLGQDKGLRDFYLNPEIGQQQMEENRRIGAIATEALRYADKGILFDEARIKQIGAAYGDVTEAAAQQKAASLYQTVGESLKPMTTLAGIYERPTQTTTEMAPSIQKELENETLYSMPSERRKRLAGLNIAEFERQSGTLVGAQGNISLSKTSSAGMI